MDVNIMAGGRVGQPGLARCTPAVGMVGRLAWWWRHLRWVVWIIMVRWQQMDLKVVRARVLFTALATPVVIVRRVVIAISLLM